MPWTKSSPPDVAKNKPAEQIEACVLAANRTLERGGTEEEAIFACVGAMKAVSKSASKPLVKQEKKLPSHFPTAEMFKALREEQKEEVKKALVLPAFLSKHSLPEGVERNVIAINFDKVGKLVVAFDTGEIITTDAVAIKEIVEQHIGVSVEGGIKEIVAGDGITVDNTDPKRPVISSTGGVAGQASQTIVGATVVINPNQNPSVTDADAGPNADLRFSLPRAREVNVVATNTVAPDTSASVTQAADAEGDVNLTFNIPRGAKGWSPVLAVVADGARRVLRLIDYVDGEGTKPTIPTDNYIGTTGLTTLANAVDIRGEVGATGPAANSFTNIAVTGQNTVVADQANDTLTLVAGANIAITTDDVTDTITISNTSVATNAFGIVTGNTGTATADLPTDTLAITGGTGISTAATDTPDGLVITNTDTGSAAITAHEAAADPHPQYTTTAEAAAAAPVQSVNGQTGNVTIPAATNNNATTRTAPTASASTALTTIASLPIAAGEIVAGSEYEFFASLRVINTLGATDSVVTVSVGATNVLVLTQANDTLANDSPGAPVMVRGRITFYSATQAECLIHFARNQGSEANTVLNTSATVTVAAATATTIDLKYNTSATSATFICRQATIQRVK